VDEYGVEIEALIGEYGPDQQPCPASALEMAEYEQAREPRRAGHRRRSPRAVDRPTQEKRAARADRRI